MFAAILAVTLSQWGPEPSPGMRQYDPGSVCGRAGGRCFQNRSGNRPRENYAFFEFAPSSGAGMGTACACAAITGAKGEALTFTRTGDATCSKQGLATTGISNGDLVTCVTDQPRVESSGGVLGLRVESARTNSLLRSQEFDNAAWGAGGSPVAVVTANFAVAPDGTTTAERLQVSACPLTTDFSAINQTATVASPSSQSVFLRANTGTPSVSVCVFGITTGTRTCTPVALTTASWTRVLVENTTNTGGMNLEIGCENRTASYTGASNTGAADVLIWGASMEGNATYATSYIPTVAAAVTRNEDVPVFSVTRQVATGSIAMSVDPQTTIVAGGFWAATDTNGRIPYAGTGTVALYDGVTAVAVTPVPSYSVGSIQRVGGFWSGASMTVFGNTANSSGAFDGTMGAAGSTLTLGGSAVGGALQPGIYSRLCYDPSPSRCTP